MDAQLPRRLAMWVAATGHDVLHTLDLPQQNLTADGEINQISLVEQRVVVTKDADFVDSFLLGQGPYKLLLVSTGNITNNDLIALFEQNFEQLVDACTANEFVELGRTSIIIHS